MFTPGKEQLMKTIHWLIALTLAIWPPLALHAEPVREITREKVATALPQLEKLAHQTLKKTGVPGMAIVVVHNDKIVYLKGFGVRKAGTDKPVNGNTVFQLASVSKPITSTVLAALVGQGVIQWDDRVIDHYPGFRLYDSWVTRQITLRDLLCHRSGLPAFAGDLLEDLGYERMEILRRLRYLKPDSSFRSQYAYTNFGYSAAAIAAAKAAGKSWEDLVADTLYKPLGMKSSSSRFANYSSADNRALLHVPENGSWVTKYVRNADSQAPAGGVSSTARDLGEWIRLQLGDGAFDGKHVIAADALNQTHRPQIVTGFNPKTNRASFYGMGWNVSYDDRGRFFLSHSGAFNLGARTEVSLLPAENIGIGVLVNAGANGVPEGMSKSFFDLVLRGKIQKDWITLGNRLFAEQTKEFSGYDTDYGQPPVHKSPPLPKSAYQGTYGNSYFGPIEIVEREGTLFLLAGPKKTPFALQHWNRDIFVYQPKGESAEGKSGVIFRIGAKDRAVKVVVENLDAHGQGLFTRVPAVK
jgi:CubicO group peptidase (beta-lactamase class C family)